VNCRKIAFAVQENQSETLTFEFIDTESETEYLIFCVEYRVRKIWVKYKIGGEEFQSTFSYDADGGFIGEKVTPLVHR